MGLRVEHQHIHAFALSASSPSLADLCFPPILTIYPAQYLQTHHYPTYLPPRSEHASGVKGGYEQCDVQ